MRQRSIVAVLVLSTVLPGTANVRMVGPADTPGTPDYTLARFLSALYSADAGTVAVLYDEPDWSGTPWENRARDNRGFVERSLSADGPRYTYSPPREPAGPTALDDLLRDGRAVRLAELHHQTSAGWETSTYYFLLERREGEWRVILFDEAP